MYFFIIKYVLFKHIIFIINLYVTLFFKVFNNFMFLSIVFIINLTLSLKKYKKKS